MAEVGRTFDPQPAESQLANWLGNHTLEMLPNNTSMMALPLISPEVPHSITNLRSEPIDKTIDVALSFFDDGRNVIPHLSASRISQQKAHAVGTVLHDSSIDHVFIMNGDRDGSITSYTSSLDLLEDWRSNGITFGKLGIVGHPEGLAAVPDHELDQALRDKQEFAENIGAHMYVVTQMCFDPSAIASWIRHIREADVYLPIIVGLPGPVDVNKLIRYSGMCGIGGSIESLHSDPDLSSEKSTAAGRTFEPTSFLKKLADETDESMGIQGTYFFTFNEPSKTLDWLSSAREVTISPASTKSTPQKVCA